MYWKKLHRDLIKTNMDQIQGLLDDFALSKYYLYK